MTTFSATEKNKVKIEFVISHEQMIEAKQKAFIENKNKFNIPGFRRGKAPRYLIERQYGEDVFFTDAFEIAFPDAYSAAIDELDLYTVSKPENVDIENIDETGSITVTAEAWIKPEVKLGQYTKLKVKFNKKVVSDEDVDAEIEKIAEKNARFVDVDRAAELGDKVQLNYSGSVDGVIFDGGTAENQTLDLGSKSFIEGFEEQVVGMKAGEHRDITVTFPTEYHSEQLAGAEAIFAIDLLSVKDKELPTIDDDFAADSTEFDTLAELKADFREKLEKQAQSANKNDLDDLVLTKAVENAEVDIPRAMVETQINYELQQMEYSLMYQGLDLKSYMEYTGLDMPGLRKQFEEVAERKVKAQLVFEAIKDKEKIDVSDAEIDEEIKKLAEAGKKEPDEYKASMKEEQMEYIKDRALTNKLVDFVVGSAIITEEKK